MYIYYLLYVYLPTYEHINNIILHGIMVVMDHKVIINIMYILFTVCSSIAARF
jgi:hypothetical protein